MQDSTDMMVDLAAPLLEELEAAAAEAKLTLPTYVTEVLESHAASRRLPKVTPSLGAPAGVLRESHGEDGDFPWPADTYHVHVRRAPGA